jgi:hypothetical protein
MNRMPPFPPPGMGGPPPGMGGPPPAMDGAGPPPAFGPPSSFTPPTAGPAAGLHPDRLRMLQGGR